MTTTKNTFKISELPAITKIDPDDLFIVADKDAAEPISTKNMSIKQLMDHIASDQFIANHIKDNSTEISKAIASKISTEISTGQSSQQIDQKIDSKVEQTIEEATFDAGSAD